MSIGSKKNLVSSEALDVRKAMVERDNPMISVKRQAALLTVNRTSVYRPAAENRLSDENIQLMHQIDVIYMDCPFYGYRRMTRALKNLGFMVNRKRIRRLMQHTGLEAVYPKPNLSKRLHAKYRRPYLLRGLVMVERYIQLHNHYLPHQSLQNHTPEAVYNRAVVFKSTSE